MTNLRQVAVVTGVQFEWLASGRGAMTLCDTTRLDSIATAEALLIDEPLELRLLAAFRNSPPQTKVAVVEIVEQLARQRIGSARSMAVGKGRPAPSFEV